MKHMMTFSKKVASMLLLFIFTFSSFVTQAEIVGDAKNGKKLFKTNCGACHKLDKIMVGPALTGVTERRSEEWLLAWIKDNAALRASGDADAQAIYDEFGGAPMNAFPFLSDQDVYDILQYTIEGDPVVAPGPGVTPGANVPVAEPKDYSLYILLVLGVLFALLLAILIKMRNTLKVVKGEDPESLGDDIRGIWGAFARNKFMVTIATITVAVFFLAELYWYLMGVGIEQGYQPVQPIAFSHEIHAGENKVDCNYCHSSARHSKTSGIPSANVCMNCHMMIDGSEIADASGNLKYDGEPSPEIAKIYESVGWDVNTKKYIEGYEQKPIKWVRIHNLPDLAYFNHAQHVSAGNVECQTCHGPVETMEEVYQYSELTMGWCINCHRETEVDVKNNAYYEGIHDKLAEKYHGEKITVDKIGGLECGKCHY
jgi:cytochrome c551/c552